MQTQIWYQCWTYGHSQKSQINHTKSSAATHLGPADTQDLLKKRCSLGRDWSLGNWIVSRSAWPEDCWVLPKESLVERGWWCWLPSQEYAYSNLWVGWGGVLSLWGAVSWAHQANTDLDLAMLGKGSTQARWCLSVACTGWGLNTRTMAAVPPVPAPKPLNSVLPCISLLPSELPSICWSPGWVLPNEWICMHAL